MDVTAVVMGKLPAAGRVKTRLVPPLSFEQAADVHGLFLRHTLERLSNGQGEIGLSRVCLCYDAAGRLDAYAAVRRKYADLDLEYYEQSGSGLGHRLKVAYGWHMDRTAVLFLGADSPDVPTSHLKAAADLLGDGEALVLGPCDDGGFWCLGVPPKVHMTPLVMGDVEWSSGRELAQVRERAAAEGLRVLDAPAWSDVDRPGDLATLYARLARGGEPADHALLDKLQNVVPHALLTGDPE